MRIRLKGIATAAVLLLAAQPAQAQWNVSAFGGVEYDTNETLFTLLGLSMSPSSPGWHPVFSLSGYRLGYDAGTSDVTLWSFRPAVGLENSFDGGSFMVDVGYAIVDGDADPDAALPPGVVVPAADVEDGVSVGAQLNYWGTGGPLGGQLLGSYNFGAESFWGRARVTTRLAGGDNGQFRVGGEAAYQKAGDFSALQPGAVLEWHTARGLILVGGVGRKLVDEGDDATYFKLEFVLPIR